MRSATHYSSRGQGQERQAFSQYYTAKEIKEIGLGLTLTLFTAKDIKEID
jgi:hypothetical protein